MKLLAVQEMFMQSIRLLDDLENDDGQIPKRLWKERNRILNNAQIFGYETYNGKANYTPDFNMKSFIDE